MPLNKFIPTSPDLNITKDSDMGMAQFGHLNTIVDYLNTYVAADSLQLEGVGPLSATARYITDSAGNLSSLAISTGNIGIGTTNATARLRVITADTNGIAEFFQNGSVGSPLHLTRYGGNVPINLNTSGGTSTSPTPLVDNTTMSRITTNTYNGTAFGTSARIEVVSKGVQSATNYGSNMRFFVTAENAIVTSEVLSILSSGNVQINEGIANDRNAKLFIKGSGSTSATTSLLVQNSAGTETLSVNDAGNLYVRSSIVFLNNTNFNIITSNFGGVTFDNDGVGSVRCSFTNGRFSTNDKVGFGNYNNYASAQVSIDSTTRGFLPPRMTTAQKNLIATPTIGLQIFDTDLNRPCFYNGAWVTL